MDEPTYEKIYNEGYRDAIQEAIDVIRDKFFGGPTQDMIVGWLENLK